MHAQLDPGSDARLSYTPRRETRRRILVRALVRAEGSWRIDIDIVDLSQHGFRFESTLGFAPGSCVFVSLPTLQPLQAHVAWHHGTSYGCQLVRPLQSAVFETLASRFG